ncbi:unnamed protein product, partial [Didymodactylos carnosus]
MNYGIEAEPSDLLLNDLYKLYYYTCNKDVDLTVTAIYEYLDVERCEENTIEISTVLDVHTAKNKNRFDACRRLSNQRRETEFQNIVLRKSELKQRQNPPKRTTRDFSSVGTKQKKRKLTDLNNELDDFARDNSISVNQVLGFLIQQRNDRDNKKLAEIGKQPYETGDLQDTKKQLDYDETLAMKSHLELSRNQVDFLKGFLHPYIKISNREYVRNYWNDLLPAIAPWRNNTEMLIADRETVIIITIKRLIEMLRKQNTSVPTKLEYREKTGHDGAGNMSIYKSKDTPMQNTNIFSKMFVPLSLKDSTGEVVWRNESPNSSRRCRPLGLIAEKEST